MSAGANSARGWLEPLLERYRTAMLGNAGDLNDLANRYETLRLACGVARRFGAPAAKPAGKLAGSPASLPTAQHLVVIGPTQAGKSSLVNHLVDRSVAGVSALAGHTVHAQAFAPEGVLDQHSLDVLVANMAPLIQRERSELARDDLGSWSLQSVTHGSNTLAPQHIVWDTPDFDSIEAGRYREAVLAPAALADTIILVLSKDKYGDMSVWERIDALALLGTPLIVVLNKLDNASQATVAAAFASRWAERTDTPPPDTILIPWAEGQDWDDKTRTQIRDALESASQRATDTKARTVALQRFVDTHQHDWLLPLQVAAQMRERWQEAVHDVLEQANASYVARYLDDTERFDALQRTIAELLTLLELPGIASVLSRTRSVVTWPARTLFGMGRKHLGKDTATEDQELDVLEGIFKDTMLALREFARDAEEAGDPTGRWRSLDRALASEQDVLAGRWREKALALREAYQPRIEASAHELHDRLAEQPALLNTLRATRATTDAAGVALAVKSGGLAPADLILAPAMLSITSLLTESALGRYMDGISTRLKEDLALLVREELITSVLGNRLLQLERDISETGLLGKTLDPGLEQALEAMATASAQSGANQGGPLARAVKADK
jgi:GTP-binding protein EngB required for normal cell division